MLRDRHRTPGSVSSAPPGASGARGQTLTRGQLSLSPPDGPCPPRPCGHLATGAVWQGDISRGTGGYKGQRCGGSGVTGEPVSRQPRPPVSLCPCHRSWNQASGAGGAGVCGGTEGGDCGVCRCARGCVCTRVHSCMRVRVHQCVLRERRCCVCILGAETGECAKGLCRAVRVHPRSRGLGCVCVQSSAHCRVCVCVCVQSGARCRVCVCVCVCAERCTLQGVCVCVCRAVHAAGCARVRVPAALRPRCGRSHGPPLAAPAAAGLCPGAAGRAPRRRRPRAAHLPRGPRAHRGPAPLLQRPAAVPQRGHQAPIRQAVRRAGAVRGAPRRRGELTPRDTAGTELVKRSSGWGDTAHTAATTRGRVPPQ
ncbi:hypothetical protein Q9966_012598 [Columba livia]|nr:hypothetical protein Q9966_012598 [Columba livia]